MANINQAWAKFREDASIKQGTMPLRHWLDSEGYSGHSINMDLYYYLVGVGKWHNTIPESILNGWGSDRYYWKANGASYGQIVPAELEAGSIVAINYLTPSKASINADTDAYICDSSTTRATVILKADGTWAFTTNTLRLYLDGERVVYGDNYPLDGLEHTLTLEMISIASLSHVAVRYSEDQSFFAGFITSLSITGITNTDAYPTGTAHWKMDTDASKDGYVFAESDNEFGELVVNGDFSEGGEGWGGGGTSFIDDEAIMSGAYSTLQQHISVANGFYYRVEYTITEDSIADNFRLSSSGFGGSTIELSHSVGEHSVVVECEDDSAPLKFILGASTENSISITDISVKQTTAMQLYNAVPTDFFTSLPKPGDTLPETAIPEEGEVIADE